MLVLAYCLGTFKVCLALRLGLESGLGQGLVRVRVLIEICFGWGFV